MIIQLSTGELTAIIVVSVIAFIAIGVLLYFLVFSRLNYRKQVANLEKQYSHFDALLLGQDTQYIHRLEIISRTNLLYLSKYESFYRRFKIIHDNEEAYAESLIKQLKSLLAAKQYKNIKSVINEAKKAIEVLEDSVKNLDSDLYNVIKLEEDCRKTIDNLREVYRHVKQTYYSEANELEMVASTFNKMFDKLDASFAKFDDQLEGAEYEEINAEAANLNNVLTALGHILIELPKLCSYSKVEIPQLLSELQTKYKETEKEGVPLYHLAFKNHVEDWKKRLSDISKRIINLQVAGIKHECEIIIFESTKMSQQLDDEITARTYFKEHYETVYRSVNDVEKVFLRICAVLPEIKKIYIISDSEEEKIDSLSKSVNDLGNSKRYLDGFVHSGTRQPFSLLKSKLDELEANYSIVNQGVNNFKTYIDSLKSTAEEAFNMISVYYFQTKEAERALREVNVDSFTEMYQEKLEAVYEVLNDIYQEVQTVPINVEEVNNKINNLKSMANAMFEDIESNARTAKVAEKAIMLLNRDRDEQDINQTVNQLELAFSKADFQSVYSQANSLYKNRHSDNEA